jgi:glycosyl-4,4'-diaponeurosporenoate acyltransferase
MPIELPLPWVVALNIGGWPVIQLALAWAFTRMPAAWFRPPRPLRAEGDGSCYRRWLAVHRWKDRLPDGASWFAGGVAKARLGGRRPADLERFAREAWRGELCHWSAIACAPVFFLWNPWWADGVMVAYALAANLPCIVVQRYNRARIARLLA